MADQTTIQENKAVVERFFEAVINGGNYEVLAETHATDYVAHNPPGADGNLEGREALKAYFKDVKKAFPDLTAEVEQVVAEDDYVTARVTYTGTHEGTFMDIPATGETATIEGMVMNRFEDGKVVETWGQIDELSLMEQLGAL